MSAAAVTQQAEAGMIFQALAEKLARNHTLNMDGQFFIITGLDDAKSALSTIFEGRSVDTTDLEAMRAARQDVLEVVNAGECPVVKRLRRNLHAATFG